MEGHDTFPLLALKRAHRLQKPYSSLPCLSPGSPWPSPAITHPTLCPPRLRAVAAFLMADGQYALRPYTTHANLGPALGGTGYPCPCSGHTQATRPAWQFPSPRPPPGETFAATQKRVGHPLSRRGIFQRGLPD